jgi:hypothetical protein
MRIMMTAALVLAGCAGAPPVEARGEGKCNAAKAQKLIGRTKSAKTGADALHLSGAKSLRWIAPGAMVTMDYREDRINLRIDPKNRVGKVDCG